jgi:hypothetical protein
MEATWEGCVENKEGEEKFAAEIAKLIGTLSIQATFLD